MNIYAEEISENIKNHFSKYFQNETIKHICNYCSYCLDSGKRIRPSISLDICKSLTNSTENVSEASLISEYFHTASLIIDDLPCMDNAKERRGLPSCHVKYGEAVTQLASVVFVSLGFDCIQRGYDKIADKNLNNNDIIRILFKEISHVLGSEGLAGGQMIDLSFEKADISKLLDNKQVNLDEVIQKKTGSLFELSFYVGWLFGGGDVNLLEKTIFKALDKFESEIKDDGDKNYIFNQVIGGNKKDVDMKEVN
jgi:geranylgeranyl diphosphate synthase type II